MVEKSIFRSVVCFVPLVSMGVDAAAQSKTELPNIIVIIADDSGYGDVSLEADWCVAEFLKALVPIRVESGVSDALVSQIDLYSSCASIIGSKERKGDSEDVSKALMGNLE